MPPRRGRARNNGKRNSNGKRPPDLKQRAEGRDAKRAGAVDGEAGDGGDAGEDVEEDACGFGHAFTQPARAAVLEVELALRDGADVGDMSGNVALNCFGSPNFEIVGCEPVEVVSRHVDVGLSRRDVSVPTRSLSS